MSLSGELVQVTNGTLVLLGIAGAAGIAAKTHSGAQGAAAETAAAKAEVDKAKAGAAAAQTAATPADPAADLAAKKAADLAAIADAARARADALKNPPPGQVPKWSVNENTQGDGTTTLEIDVARFQMLLFTLITAAFVLISVMTTYVIPEISTGFLTLMGISNGVYVGSKVAQGS
jgi:hypothetical protein